MRVSSSPLPVDRIPFANETELQRFVVHNAKALLGLNVVASTLRNGRPLHKIDILAVNEAGGLYIIECKHDVVDSGAFAQLIDYSKVLLADWRRVQERVLESCGHGFRLAKQLPVLVTVGYRYDVLPPNGPAVQPLVFRYDRAFGRFVDSQSSGVVHLAVFGQSDAEEQRHPEVLKTHYAESNLADLPPEVRERFWAVDARLRKVDYIQPKYSGKKTHILASYRRGRETLIAARISQGAIIWSFNAQESGDPDTIEMGPGTDPDRVAECLERAV